MKYRKFAGTDTLVSEVGLGTWQLGGSEWGAIPEPVALATIQSAAESGVTFIDTADIYGQGRSESLIGKFLRYQVDPSRFFVATKLGRGSDPGWPENFEPKNVRLHTERSLKRLGVEAISLTQTHCIPPEIMRQDSFWDSFRQLKREGKIRAFGASVESVDEALDCLEIDGLSSLQIIFNVFRQKPIAELFEKAEIKNVSIIVRLPLASGLLSGKMSKGTQFAAEDHRNFNRDGQAFNVGETFAGLPFERGLELVETLRDFVPAGWSMADWALRWCLDFPEVTTVIPGASCPEQAKSNSRASDLTPLSEEAHEVLANFYQNGVAEHIRGKY